MARKEKNTYSAGEAAGEGLRICLLQPSRIEETMKIYAGARRFMANHGNPGQWGDGYPPRDLIEHDIAEKCAYACMAGERIAAVFYYREGQDPTYREIFEGRWLNDLPYGVVHRIASAGIVRGAGAFCLDWAFARCGNLRIDTHRDNLVMQSLLAGKGFTRCGIIYLPGGKERLAYQKCKE